MPKKTVEAYSRAVRRARDYFDCCPDKLEPEQLQDYFADLVKSYSWSTIKVDRLGLQHFWKFVLKRDWKLGDIVKTTSNQNNSRYPHPYRGRKAHWRNP